MKYLKFDIGKKVQLWRFDWHYLFFVLILIAIITLVTLTIVSSQRQAQTIWLTVAGAVCGVAVLATIFAMLLLTHENVKSIKENGETLDTAVDMINRNRNLLVQIAKGVRLSDGAKEIAFRDSDRMELTEAAIGKLHQHDFDSAYAMIDAMAARSEYKDLAEQLRKKADSYKSATEKERIRQAIEYVDKLCEQYLWAEAGAQVQNLLKTFGAFDEIQSLSRRLADKKDNRKKHLLALWDDAVQRKDTNRSLDILKELDLYLTPTEGLALQESASTVFRTKLHNLGVEFALAVTEKRWKQALAVGEQIARDFPNSRMAHEIRGKMDILQQKAH
jgi:hypothetical protein